jgi:hypothetical protein
MSTPNDAGNKKNPAAKAGPSSLRRHVGNAVPTLIVIAAIILFWEFFNVITGEPEYVLPPLHKILATAIDRAGDRFLPAAWVTLQEMLFGFAFGVSSGFLLGTLIFQFETMRRALLPIVISTQAVPVIAVAPHPLVRLRHDTQGDGRRLDLVLPCRHQHDLGIGLGRARDHQPDAFVRRERTEDLHHGPVSGGATLHLRRNQERGGDQRDRRHRRRMGRRP